MAEPTGILAEIAATKRRELAARFDGVALDALRTRAQSTERSLTAALARPGARFILEIKKASPSAGAIRAGADPAAIARGYAGVADALSVLIDATYFGGALADLTAARGGFGGPILAKDFFLDPRQVVEARIAGADAVLVMLSLVDDPTARNLIAEARALGMDALVEVHDEQEMQRALALDAPLIGINNRDFKDLSIDLSTTERLAPLARGRTLVSESGISSRSDIDRLASRVDAFLIGSSLMQAPDPAQAARALLFGRVKLCGLTRREDISAGAAAAFAGFVLVPGTPRHIGVEQAAPLAGMARQAGIRPVGVFRNASHGIVGDVATLLNLHAVQLHGGEDGDYVRGLRRQLPRECEIWTALSVGRDPLRSRGGDRLLFDNGDGGTGRSFDWTAIKGHPELPSSIVAGGIGAENARSAAMLGGYAMDCGSAVEAAPGKKSAEKIGVLFDALRPRSRMVDEQCA
ncbi:bifunctional indole-3-glycerol-phosphate synthase TrpC/phosphoribosylanthranilate isomerase TrpF [Sphingomonas sinipercae]|uniref:Multifunctional fusion protein n=1 Tax=Sphingomonas sinipercae TaxID=2714944 RepID=A0A6G7ZQD0_9SPHN|nr:bifunctional indole-3-glycerol-phosphate synthase TrpC/phosphoribosylanthranilate isomerase TrpF [Sphingomonas sinipercae]QIL03138.1 bifunctional indole-3-glycerol-phosphate synthase TrpC/phosphoribosylanthranilate isomerase TrpF [Sphingomonas sinipercae]